MLDIKVPSPGESVTEGTIARWLKPNGAFVQNNEPLFELESDKAALEVNAPAAGVLQIVIPEGSKVQVGTVAGRIDETASPPKEGAKAAAAPPSAEAARVSPAGARPRRRPAWTWDRSPAAAGTAPC